MDVKRIALIGNPNTGKSSVFNLLTGLRQHIGNFPGVTVEKKSGTLSLSNQQQILVTDLPGTYSIFPRSADEKVVFDVVSNPKHPDFPDLFVVVADAANLERNLLLFSQLNDLRLPVLLVLTMEDLLLKRKQSLNIPKLSERLGNVPVVMINGRSGKGIDKLKKAIAEFQRPESLLYFTKTDLKSLFDKPEEQAKDTEDRFGILRNRIEGVFESVTAKGGSTSTTIWDKIFVHPVFGYVIFLALLMMIFQFIYRFATVPMDLIDGAFLDFSQLAKAHLPAGVFTDLIAEGVIPGVGGVAVFIPQIALLFFFLAIMEETGYMSRVVFLMDRLVRPFGLNGRSVVPLMSSVACAIPGIMATRTISNWKERLITIMVSPLMSCSARIPVYTLLIALVIPEINLWGVFDLRGLVLLGLYALGLFSALAIAGVMKMMIRTKEHSYLMMEMPEYRAPRWKQVFIHVWERVRVFIWDAGKIILAISILLWALASYGPSDRIDVAVKHTEQSFPADVDTLARESALSAVRLENSYIGILGKGIEPVIAPLGYDWKIGIALITSFAAREVFVGSMATIYSVGEDFSDDTALLDRMRDEKRAGTDMPLYNLATGLSLLVFYVYAMQCLATFAVVKRETHSWKWPLIQVLYMGILAYAAAFMVYHLMS